MSVHLTSGPARVLASGTVTTWFGHGLELELELDGVPLRLAVTFAEGPTPAVDTRALDDGWALLLTGFGDGRGSAEPALLGAFGDDLVFLHFRVFRFGATQDHTLHYTLHRVAKAQVGWRDADEAT